MGGESFPPTYIGQKIKKGHVLPLFVGIRENPRRGFRVEGKTHLRKLESATFGGGVRIKK